MLQSIPFNQILYVALAFVATLCYAVGFNVPKKELAYAGLVGALGWSAHLFFAHLFGASSLVCTLAGAMVVTFASRVLAVHRKMPLTLFLISGIIPLVPGAGIYNTMYYTIINELQTAVQHGLSTFKTAGVISLGIMLVLALPPRVITPFGKTLY